MPNFLQYDNPMDYGPIPYQNYQPASFTQAQYGQGTQSANPGLRKAIADAFAESQSGNTMTADEAGGEYAPLIRSQGQYPYMVKMLQSQGLDPSKYSGVNLGLLNTVLSYDGVSDPMKALDMIQQAGPGWTDEAGYRDGIVHALKNNLSPADAQKFTADYQSSHSAGTNAINNSIKAGLAVMTAMAGAGMAGYGPAATGLGEAGSAVPSLGTAGTTVPSLTGGAVTAGDLALTAMPEVTASSMGMTGAQAAGLGSAGAAAGNGLLSAPSMAAPNAVTAADLALTPMPQVTASSMGLGEAAAGAGAAGGLLGNSSAGMSTAIDGSAGMNGAQAANAATGATIGNGATGGMSTPITGSGLLQTGSTLGNIADSLGGAKNLGSVVGGLLGAATSKDTTTSSSKDPWAPAQPYLLDNLKQNAALQKQYMDNPFSDKQKQYFQNMDTDINNFRTNVNPKMQAFAQQAMTGPGYQRQAQAMPQFQTGRPDWLKGLLGG